MLGAVRTGKRKRSRKVNESNTSTETISSVPLSSASSSFAETEAKASSSSSSSSSVAEVAAVAATKAAAVPKDNMSAADRLRQQLQQNLSRRNKSKTHDSYNTKEMSPSITSNTNTKTAITKKGILSDSVSRRMDTSSSFIRDGEKYGREGNNKTILLSNSFSSSNKPALRTEDMRRGSRKGKLKTPQPNSTSSSSTSTSISMDIQQMIQQETNSKMSMDEIFARNIARLGSKYKGTGLLPSSSSSSNAGAASAGANEVDFHGDGGVDIKMFQTMSEQGTLTEQALLQREKSRQIAHHQKINGMTSKCWWWMESSSFPKHLLLSLGNHVSLVLVPKHLAFIKGHCFLVPVKHADSFLSCEDEVWDEVQRFRAALRSMYEKEGKSVLFCETVLSSKSLWQARMDVIPVPKHVELDVPLHFKSALNEQAEEWGTHTKVLSTHPVGLRRTIPKNFPYVNVEWNNGGYAQILESNSFPKDFLLDTIGSIMHMDPIRFHRKKRKKEDADDRTVVLDFCKRFKQFDWTYHLD